VLAASDTLSPMFSTETPLADTAPARLFELVASEGRDSPSPVREALAKAGDCYQVPRRAPDTLAYPDLRRFNDKSVSPPWAGVRYSIDAQGAVRDVKVVAQSGEAAFADAAGLHAGEKIDLLLSGENGDNRILKYYTACEALMPADTMIARFKHMTGEYTTSGAVAGWLACHILATQSIPKHMIKRGDAEGSLKHILIYNNYRGEQHSCMLLSIPV